VIFILYLSPLSLGVHHIQRGRLMKNFVNSGAECGEGFFSASTSIPKSCYVISESIDSAV
jgi:hypothetical protein